MKQVFITGDGQIVIREVADPVVTPGRVLVRAHYSAISTGTEVSTITMRRANPGGTDVPSGYSLAGQVVGVGEDVKGINVGDLVSCGGYNISVHAEYVSVPVNFCVVLAQDSDLRKVAFSTIAAISLQAVRLAHLSLGETAVIIGTGIIGQFAAMLARLSGARTVVIGHRNQMRLDIARRLGAELAAMSESTDLVEVVSDFTDGIGADAVLHCAKTESQESLIQALDMAREKGTVVLVGGMPIEMPRRPLFRKELNFVVSRSTGPGRFDLNYEMKGIDYPVAYVRWTGRRNQAECARLIANGRLDVGSLITHEFPFASAPEALELVATRGSETVGVVFRYDTAQDDGRLDS
jgi:2-desacetyl-2-hydroxyethyl bacteriochlorophyllide A dehydrogenase